MSALLVHFRAAWDDYFPLASLNYFYSQTYSSRQTFSSTAIYISNCLFKSITSTSSHGGALYYCRSGTNYFLVESSSFFSCNTSSGYGGAIYVYNTDNCQSVLYEVCGYDCCSTHSSPYYQFAWIRVNGGISNKNYVYYSSITRCVNANSNSRYTLSLYNANICCRSVNISLNKCQLYSGIYCYPCTDYNSYTCSFSYSTFADNVANGYTCILLSKEPAKYEIKSCNIIRNTQGSLNTEGTIYTSGNLMIEDSCILENKANYIFYQRSSYIITLSNCTVDSTSNYGNLNTRNTVTKSFILALKHMSTQYCHAEYDSVGSLTPNLQPFLKMQMHYTCDTFINNLPKGTFFSLFTLFILDSNHRDSSV
jgi:hypothetical protein